MVNIVARIATLASAAALFAGVGTTYGATGRNIEPQDTTIQAAPTPYPPEFDTKITNPPVFSVAG